MFSSKGNRFFELKVITAFSSNLKKFRGEKLLTKFPYKRIQMSGCFLRYFTIFHNFLLSQHKLFVSHKL